jgi:hypothetical protein
MGLRRQELPPDTGPEINVVRLKANESINVLILSPKIWGFMCHWNGAFTEPCHDGGGCNGCSKGYPIKWKGFLYCIDEAHRVNVFLELTPKGRDSIVKAFRPGEEMRGARMIVQRGRGDKARLIIQFQPCLPNSENLPRDLDPAPTLEKLWGIVPGKLRVYRNPNLDKTRRTG